MMKLFSLLCILLAYIFVASADNVLYNDVEYESHVYRQHQIRAPDVFKVIFQTTVPGDIELTVYRFWAPNGADRFYELMMLHPPYYTANGFFRVVPGFVVQFGLSGIPSLCKMWQNREIKDDPVVQSNTRGMVSYASAGPNTRTTQIFINYGDNSGLDSQGFAPFANVTKGLDIALKINAQYGQSPSQTAICNEGNTYLKKNFPKLDYITGTRIEEGQKIVRDDQAGFYD